MSRLCIRYPNHGLLAEKDILSKTFADISCGSEQEKNIYTSIVLPYLNDVSWLQMRDIVHHKYTNRLMHCMHVSYLCFLYAYRHHWDYISAAIGGLLHDFVLFNKKDYRVTSVKRIWCFYHPQAALQMSEAKYVLTDKVRDMIAKHMFPAAFAFPRYKETWLIVYWDKYCAVRERFHKTSPKHTEGS